LIFNLSLLFGGGNFPHFVLHAVSPPPPTLCPFAFPPSLARSSSLAVFSSLLLLLTQPFCFKKVFPNFLKPPSGCFLLLSGYFGTPQSALGSLLGVVPLLSLFCPPFKPLPLPLQWSCLNPVFSSLVFFPYFFVLSVNNFFDLRSFFLVDFIRFLFLCLSQTPLFFSCFITPLFFFRDSVV